MANYRNNRGSMYSSIQNLNTIPTEYDTFPQLAQDGFDADLDMFMNTQLFDFDMGTTTENNSPAAANFADNEVLGMMAQQPHQQLDFSNLSPEFNLSGSSFNTLPSNVSQQQQQPQLQSQPKPQQQPQQQQFPIQLQPHLYPAPQSSTTNTTTTSSPAIAAPSTDHSLKCKATEPLSHDLTSTDPTDSNEAARFAAEEDKRRRNTAASARFRVKKKQREAQLEKTAKEMTDRVRDLEQKVGQLEMENKLLKELVTEKRGEGEVEEVVEKVREMGRVKAEGAR